MIFPGTIPETPISREWSRRLERPPDHVLYGGRPYGGFVNSTVDLHRPLAHTRSQNRQMLLCDDIIFTLLCRNSKC